jgi:5-methylcytosine-specific restriction endonuclease McrA
VHFTADTEFRELLEEVRAPASHREPEGNLLSLMKRGLEAYWRELQKQRFGVGRKPRRVRREAVGKSPARSRHVPAAVSREVYLRDDGRCTFCSKDGRRCGARRYLQLDHVTPWAVDGQSSVENLRLRCRAHNLHAARLYFGAGFMRNKQGRAAATGSAAALSSASRESVQREASSALDASPED